MNEMTANHTVLAVALMATIEAGSAVAADPPTASSAPAAPSVTVTAPKKHDFDPNAVICRTDVPTGTMFAKKVCMTSAQWDLGRQRDVDAVRQRFATPESPGEQGTQLQGH
jgi:hypothetical protein